MLPLPSWWWIRVLPHSQNQVHVCTYIHIYAYTCKPMSSTYIYMRVYTHRNLLQKFDPTFNWWSWLISLEGYCLSVWSRSLPCTGRWSGKKDECKMGARTIWNANAWNRTNEERLKPRSEASSSQNKHTHLVQRKRSWRRIQEKVEPLQAPLPSHPN